MMLRWIGLVYYHYLNIAWTRVRIVTDIYIYMFGLKTLDIASKVFLEKVCASIMAMPRMAISRTSPFGSVRTRKLSNDFS